MAELLISVYPWTKALHIISVISWMVGLLYLPRIFVYHVQNGEPGTDTSQTFKTMERRLLKLIMTPAMLASWFFGIILVLTPGVVDVVGDQWFQIKFVAILGLTYCHIWLGKRRIEFFNDANTRTARTFRLVNEVPTLLMIVAIIMVVVKPFS